MKSGRDKFDMELSLKSLCGVRQAPALALLPAILLCSAWNVAATAIDSNAQIPLPEHQVMRTTANEAITIAVESKASEASAQQTKLLSQQQAGLLRIYRSNLLKKTYQYVVYPDSAIDQNHEGDVVLRVTVDRKGKIKNIEYESRANYNSLNKAAKKALHKARPFPAVPKRLEGEQFEVLMPIRFRLTG